MQKLIKISEDHYIVIGKLETEEIGVFVYDNDYEPPIIYKTCEEFFTVGKQSYRITHSFGKELEGVENRPLSEAQEIEYGYSVEKIASKFIEKEGSIYKDAVVGKSKWIEGFNAHKKLVKNKLFSIGDMKKAIQKAQILNVNYGEVEGCKYTIKEIIQSLLPPIEWEVKFVNDKMVKIK